MADWTTLYDKLIVQRDKPETTKGEMEMVVPDVHQKLRNTGVVIRTGNGRLVPGLAYPVPLALMVGDEVLFHEHAGVNLVPDDDSIIILREDEILAYRRQDPTHE